MKRSRGLCMFSMVLWVATLALGLFNAPSASGQSSNPFASGEPGYPEWSAFTGVRWEGDKPSVRFEGEWYKLVSFHGIPVEKILKHCDDNGWSREERFAEDLVQIVRLMGHEIDKTTTLVLRDANGNVITKQNVTMTEKNRSELKRQVRESKGRVSRRPSMPQKLTREDVHADLAEFRANLEAQFAYLHANNADYVSAIEGIAAKADDEMELAEFATQLRQVMALFIDGHASVSPSSSTYNPGFLPFLVEPSADRFVAVRPDRTGFVEEEFPYIQAIDGVELSRWLAATATDLPKGSPQYMRHRGLQQIGFIQHYRQELGLEAKETIEVELVSRDGRRRYTTTCTVADVPVRGGTWPPLRGPEILAGNIGYLRLESMNGQAVQLLKEWMPKFRDTDGLVIDVRDNGGGVRTPLLELAGYLLTADAPPRVGSVAKYRLAPHFDIQDLSEARFVYPEDSDRFDDRQRAAIRQFKETFKPQWEPPVDEFSEWHYLVLAKRPDDPRFDYRQPVAILMDEGCFSATDIFLGVFKGWPNVTLVGQPSGGGSAHSQGFGLSRSRIAVRCASMASYQPSGKLYDTHGIEPDIQVERPPEYYCLPGHNDVVLQQALEHLRTKANK